MQRDENLEGMMLANEREKYYCRQLDKLQKKVSTLYRDKKRYKRDKRRLEDQVNELKGNLTSNQKFLKLMKDEMEHVHRQNKLLLEEKRKLEDFVMKKRGGREGISSDQDQESLIGFKMAAEGGGRGRGGERMRKGGYEFQARRHGRSEYSPGG